MWIKGLEYVWKPKPTKPTYIIYYIQIMLFIILFKIKRNIL